MSSSPPLSCISTTFSTAHISVIATSDSKRNVMPKPAVMMHLSPAKEIAIRLLPGNDRCADCKAICPQWAGVSFGVLLCLACAGKHRSLGVRTSFVKSLVMDAWSTSEVHALEMGGNAKWTAVCTGAGIADLAMLEKYSSSVAKAYKSHLSLATAKESSIECAFTATSFLTILAGITSPSEEAPALTEHSESSLKITTTERLSDCANDITAKCTTCSLMVPLDELNSHSKLCTVDVSQVVEWRKYERKIGTAGEPLGLTLAKTSSNYAEVSRIIPGGAAERANVIVGSVLIGLDSEKNLKFDEVVTMLRTLPRPILFHFAFRSRTVPKTVMTSMTEPKIIEFDVTLRDKEELGCSLSVNDFYCVVRSVDEECIARRNGILVGSRVVAINGQKYLKPKDLIHEICTAQRPIRITVHRVEGLMRGRSM